MRLLFSIDDQFVSQLKTTLLSVQVNSTKAEHDVYVLQKKALRRTAELRDFCTQLGMTYIPLIVGESEVFKKAPVSARYPEAIYYRLLAYQFLPESVDKILYLDADILCLNDLTPLYELELGDALYAAASHAQLTNMTTVLNRARLNSHDSADYFNSGVLLMNNRQIRQVVTPGAIYEFIVANKHTLVLPDQDILNGLYGEQIVAIPDERYNYDVRKNPTYELISKGKWDLDWVISHSVCLHFCGKDKPWHPHYTGRFGSLYKHYYHKANP